jgi:hypothetical protein
VVLIKGWECKNAPLMPCSSSNIVQSYAIYFVCLKLSIYGMDKTYLSTLRGNRSGRNIGLLAGECLLLLTCFCAGQRAKGADMAL